MEEKKKEKKLELLHQQTIYKMVIPQEVEKKIRLLCREIHNVEWSGVLFYRVSGAFEDKSLTVTCVDIFQMDEGTSGYTEYDMSPDVCSYICDHPELMEAGIYQGLIHSHNNMATFFSGTDTNTLLAEGSDMNHFVSLIVNNAGKYTAGITRRAKVKQTVNEEFSYPTWGDERVRGNRTFTVEKECVQWFNLDIEVEGVSNDFEEEMLARIKEIRASKVFGKTPKYLNQDYVDYMKSAFQSRGMVSRAETVNEVKAGPANMIERKEPVQPSLFPDEVLIDYEHLHVNEEIVDWVVKQTITCSLIIPHDSNIDVEKWAKSMDSLYSKRFENEKEFEAFASNFVDYLINYTEDPEALSYLDETEMGAILAYQVREKLSKLPRNKWLDIWMKMYDDYIL